MKNKRGITLIALVITIVVLIILAAVAINLSLGNNGIFNRAKTAKEKYANSQEYEQTETEKYADDIDGYVDGNRNGVTISNEDYQKIMDSINSIDKVEAGNYTFSTLGAKTHGYGLLFTLNVPSDANVTFTSVRVKSISSATTNTYSNNVLLLSSFGNQRTYNINDCSYSEGALGLVTVTFSISY